MRLFIWPSVKNLKIVLSVILISCLNFLCYLLLSRNMTYLYGSIEIITFSSNPFLFFLFVIKIGLAGFSLSLLLHDWLKRKNVLPCTNRLWQAAAWLILLFNLVNYFEILSQWLIFITTFSLVFGTSFLFGLLFVEAIKPLGLQYNKSLFYLLIGSTVAVVLYNALFAYQSFLYGYCALFLFMIIFMSRTSRIYKGFALIFIFGIIFFLSNKPNYGQIYVYSNTYEKKHNAQLTKAIFSPSGITDVLYSKEENVYFMYTDKNSPSTITVKGNIDAVQPHVLIPYQVKNYTNALYIGVGGGQDIVAGLYYKTPKITGIEIDPQRVQLMMNDFREYTGGLFQDPHVKIVVDGGRSFLRRSKEKFDLITLQRPWTRIITNSYLFDTSGELFTNEALDAYFNALTDGGILYWALYLDANISRHLWIMLPPLAQKSDLLKDHMVIFYPYKNRVMISILMSKTETFRNFYAQHKNEYEFAYYPGMKLAEGQNDITDIIFYKKEFKNLKTDKELTLPDFQQIYTKRFIVIVSILLLFIALIFFRGLYIHNLSTMTTAIYFLLGIGYEVVGIFFFLWLSLFIGNFMQVLPIALVIYSLLGSFGYLLSAKISPAKVASVSFLLCIIFLILYFNNLLLPFISTSSLWLVSGLMLFLLVSVFITFPFGYLIAHEKNFPRALAIDYVGSLFYIPVLFYLPNLNYLLLFSVVLYLCVGILIILLPWRTGR